MNRNRYHPPGNPLAESPTKVIVLIAAMALTANVVLAQPSYPPASLLAAKWWNWALGTPSPESPLTDRTGQFASVNQPNGTVWFLAGNQGGTTVRTVTIPVGKALFFPIANVFDVEDGTATSGGGQVFSVHEPLQVAQGVVSSIIATAHDLSCSVDGIPLAITAANLEQSTPFTLHLPTDNILGVPAGVYYPTVDSGYYSSIGAVISGPAHDSLQRWHHIL